jgi:hypothetical protein
MMATLLLLLILAAAVVALPRSERASGAIAAMAAIMTAAILAVSEAGLSVVPERWLFAITLSLAILNYLLGVGEADAGRQHQWRLR